MLPIPFWATALVLGAACAYRAFVMKAPLNASPEWKTQNMRMSLYAFVIPVSAAVMIQSYFIIHR